MPLPPLATCSHSSRYTGDDPLMYGFDDSPSLPLGHHSWHFWSTAGPKISPKAASQTAGWILYIISIGTDTVMRVYNDYRRMDRRPKSNMYIYALF